MSSAQRLGVWGMNWCLLAALLLLGSATSASEVAAISGGRQQQTSEEGVISWIQDKGGEVREEDVGAEAGGFKVVDRGEDSL